MPLGNNATALEEMEVESLESGADGPQKSCGATQVDPGAGPSGEASEPLLDLAPVATAAAGASGDASAEPLHNLAPVATAAPVGKSINRPQILVSFSIQFFKCVFILFFNKIEMDVRMSLMDHDYFQQPLTGSY